MIKVVIDTNVFVSSFFGGNPRRIIDLWKTGHLTWCLARPIIDEYVSVLKGMGLQDAGELEELLQIFAQGFHVLFASKTPDLKIIKKDPDDDKFIECAVALKSKYIITGDKALRDIENYMGVKIFSSTRFLDESGV